jgi:hypothetical protein
VEMEESKLLTRFRQFCEAYRVEYVFEGVVEGFDMAEPVDSKRSKRGMYVHTEEGVKIVQLNEEKNPSVDIGDMVVVLGGAGWLEENSVNPAVLLNPTERHAWFFRDLRPRTRCSNAIWGIPVLFAAYVIFLIAQQIEPLRGIWSYVLGVLFVIVALFSEPFVLQYNERPRLYHCDEQTWHALTTEIVEKFGIKLSV